MFTSCCLSMAVHFLPARHFVLCQLVVLPIFYCRPLECCILEWVHIVLGIASKLSRQQRECGGP
jgi:hypothetical protein